MLSLADRNPARHAGFGNLGATANRLKRLLETGRFRTGQALPSMGPLDTTVWIKPKTIMVSVNRGPLGASHSDDLGCLHTRIEAAERERLHPPGIYPGDPELRAILDDGLLIHAPLAC